MKKAILFFVIVLFAVFIYYFVQKSETPADNSDKIYTIEELQDKRRIDGIVEPVYTQDCFPETLKRQGVTKDCFENANLGQDAFCTESQINMIKEYYEKGQENDILNDGTGQFCAE